MENNSFESLVSKISNINIQSNHQEMENGLKVFCKILKDFNELPIEEKEQFFVSVIKALKEKYPNTNENICKHILIMQNTNPIFDFIYTKTLVNGCEYYKKKEYN